MRGPRQHPESDAQPSLRRALVTDASVIAEFQTLCWQAAYTGLVPQEYLDRVGVAEREVRWSDRIRTESRVVALAEEGECVVGVVSRRMSEMADAPALELTSLYVGPAYQSLGLGSQLLCHAIGEDPAHLRVFKDNPRARAFYGRHGFNANGRQAIDADTGLLQLLYLRH